MDVVYGIRILPKDDPYVEIVEKGARSIGEALVPGAFLVDYFPIRKGTALFHISFSG